MSIPSSAEPALWTSTGEPLNADSTRRRTVRSSSTTSIWGIGFLWFWTEEDRRSHCREWRVVTESGPENPIFGIATFGPLTGVLPLKRVGNETDLNLK